MSDHETTLRAMADDHASPDTEVRRQRRAACLAGADALRSRPAPPDDLDRMGLTKEQVWHLHAYVVDHAADHEDECPSDDTCDCQFAARNAAVNAIVQTLIRHLPVVKPTAPAPVAAPAPHPAGGIRTDFRGSDGEMLAPTDEARKVISDCTARGAQLPDMHQLQSAITDIIVERNRQAGVGLRFRDVNTGVITDEFGREHPPSFEAKTHQDSLQNVAAPAPESIIIWRRQEAQP